MTGLKIGSLCTGYGGLDLAVHHVFNAHTVWTSDIDEGANKIIAQRFPDAPNIGDLKIVDWSALEPVDIITAGYPCQPFSHAGKRKGLNDERHIWPYIREGVRVLRPRLVVLENVSGHRSMGLDRVLGDLAEDGLHAWWTSVRASDVGAAHRRERLFIVVAPADAGGEALGLRSGLREGDEAGIGRRRSDDDRVPGREGSAALSLLPTPSAADGDGTGRHSSPGFQKTLPGEARLLPTPSASLGEGGQTSRSGDRKAEPLLGGILLPTPRAGDGEKGGPNQRGSSGDLMLPSAVLLPTPTSRDHKGRNQRNDATCLPGALLPTPRTVDRSHLHTSAAAKERYSSGPMFADLIDADAFGQYATAVSRWANVLGRPAPAPTAPTGRDGAERLSPLFVEWLMGLPAGHVTDIDGLSRNAQLKALGNGVVPQQAAAALRLLLTATFEHEEAS